MLIQEKNRKKIIIIQFTHACNNACFFCEVAPQGYSNKKFVLAEIRLAAGRGYKSLDLSGAEPTISPHIFEYVREAQRHGFTNITLFTNGRMFYYRDFCERIIEAGLTKIIFSLHSHKQESYEKITGVKGSFAELLQGIKNLRGKKVELGGSLLVHRYNITGVHKTLDFFAARGLHFFMVSPVVPSNLDFTNEIVIDKDRMLDYNDIRRLGRNLSLTRFTSGALRFIPPCLVRGLHKFKITGNANLGNIRLVFENGKQKRLAPLIKKMVSKKNECAGCKDALGCDGELHTINAARKYLVFWCLADLHAGLTNSGKVRAILRDSNSIFWSKGFFVGDTVEGDQGPKAYAAYKKAFSDCAERRKITHVLGNHEYVYKNKKPQIAYFRKYLSNNLFSSFEDGNICSIILPIDAFPSHRELVAADTITEETFKKLMSILNKKVDFIRIVFSHYRIDLIKVGKAGLPLTQLLPRQLMPEIWVHGHGASGSLRRQYPATCFIDCGQAIHTMQSKFILFRDSSASLIIKTRDHAAGKFIGKDISVKLNKPYIRVLPDK
ncbi:MAG: radical SAM protein [Candidatus Omnitrophota bacterium]|jgi:MoaA/NifB/PqqE/SkfB family radical SAM enzyme